jgi:hypothetical protein
MQKLIGNLVLQGWGQVRYVWVIMAAVAVLVAILGIKGYRQFSIGRFTIIAGVVVEVACLSLARWLALQRHSPFAVGFCLVGAGIAWECYRHAEYKACQAVIEEIQARNRNRE